MPRAFLQGLRLGPASEDRAYRRSLRSHPRNRAGDASLLGPRSLYNLRLAFQRRTLSMEGVSGRVALVTGASQGIGRACALALSEGGASVALAARNEAKLAEVAKEIEG